MYGLLLKFNFSVGFDKEGRVSYVDVHERILRLFGVPKGDNSTLRLTCFKYNISYTTQGKNMWEDCHWASYIDVYTEPSTLYVSHKSVSDAGFKLCLLLIIKLSQVTNILLNAWWMSIY